MKHSIRYAKMLEKSLFTLQTRTALERHQEKRFRLLLNHAISHSVFYRKLYNGIDVRSVPLKSLPFITKDHIMANFNDLVTDPRIQLDAINRHMEKQPEKLFLDTFRILGTSGSTGQRSFIVFGAREWAYAILTELRRIRMMGIANTDELTSIRTCSIGSPNSMHATYHIGSTMNFGAPSLRLDASSNIDDMVSALNAFQPTLLKGYPSIIALLSERQIEGQLHIAPTLISTSSEPCTDGIRDRVRKGFLQTPYDFYGLTETMAFGSDCHFHSGVHAYEDLFILEVVDDDYQPVRDGEVGKKLLITNLFNRVQPLIRYEVTDLIKIKPDLCACGSPFKLVQSMAGRSKDVIYLVRRDGGTQPIHPIIFTDLLESISAVREFQVIHYKDSLFFKLVLCHQEDIRMTEEQIKTELRRRLANMHCDTPHLVFEYVSFIARDPNKMGKHRLVYSTA